MKEKERGGHGGIFICLVEAMGLETATRYCVDRYLLNSIGWLGFICESEPQPLKN